jgi:hypothetical protein
MGTPYSEIYDIFFSMITDYEFLALPTEIQDEILYGWLLNAIASFDKCKNDLSDRDDILMEFKFTLTEVEKLILAKLMLVNWLNPKLYSLELLRNNITTKDFNSYSNANILKEIRDTYSNAQKDVKREIVKYINNNFKFDDLN